MGERKKTETAPGALALDKEGLFDLADIAIDAARRAGADYVDIRLGETRREFAFAEDRLENFDERAAQALACACCSTAAGDFTAPRLFRAPRF